jgi:hypothetical protein
MADGAGDREIERLLGPARLAYFTPVREYPPLGDRKAVALLAAFGLMTTVLLVFAGRIGAMVERGWGSPLAWLAGAILAALVSLVMVGARYAFAALVLPIPPMPDSLAFYPHIAALTADEYRRRVLALDHPRALRHMLHYNYSLATLSVAKFRLVERSFRCVRATFELWIALLVLIAARGG